MRKVLSLVAMTMLCSVLLFGQTRIITGQVRDEKGEAVPFATISEVGSKVAVKADANGFYSIKAPAGSKLIVTAAGFEAFTISPTGNAQNFVLKTKAGQLEEVVVTTALGQTRQAKELGYSTAKVKATELNQAKVINLQNGLTGKVSGLNIQTVNNGVFADTRITLRGIRSLTGNNQPMLVLDGVPISLGYLNSINPNDIQDVTILKSSSSTAIYGPDGVNGAIVVTTRRGSKSKPIITISHTTQVERVSFMPKMQTQFGSGSSEDAYGNGVYDPIENQGYGDAFDGSIRQIGRDADVNNPLFVAGSPTQYKVEYKARPEEKKKFWNTGVTNQTDVSFATGDFYLSAQNVSIKGIVPGDENHRKSIHMSAVKEYNRFKASFNLTYTRSNYDVTTAGGDFSPYWLLINTPMEIPLTNFKNWKTDYWSNPNGYYNNYYSNPYFAIDNYRGTGNGDDFLGNVELNYRATSWLNITYRVGGTSSTSSSKSTIAAFNYTAAAKAAGITVSNIAAGVGDGTSNSNRITSEFFLNFKKDFGELKLDGLLGHSYRETNTKSIGVSTSNLGIPSLYNISARKGEPDVSESDSKTRLQRFFGKVGFGWSNWAFAEVTGSYDMDSRLANPYNYNTKDISFFYPGASVSFVLNEAIPGIKNFEALSYLKVRGAISKTGNVNLGAYSLENTFGAGENFPYGTLLGFSASNTLRQSNYKPEFVNNKEVGLEVGFLRNRINFEFTAYHQDNTNQLIQVAYSGATGYNSALLNAASFINKGLEFDLKLTPLVKIGKVNIDFKVNYTHQTSKVTKIIEGVDELGIGNGNYVIKGLPAYTFKLTDYVRDDAGRVVVNATTGLPTVDPTIKTFGQTLPTDILGLNLNVNWKSFSFAAVADYRTGNQIYAGGLGANMDFSGMSARSGSHGRQSFIFPNSSYYDGTKYVVNTDIFTPGGYSFWSQSVNTNANSNYLCDGSFWKLREVSIAYTTPVKWYTGTPIKNIVVSITGRNLFTFLPKTNEWTDPEFSTTTGNAQGVSGLGNTPPTRIFGGSITVQF